MNGRPTLRSAMAVAISSLLLILSLAGSGYAQQDTVESLHLSPSLRPPPPEVIVPVVGADLDIEGVPVRVEAFYWIPGDDIEKLHVDFAVGGYLPQIIDPWSAVPARDPVVLARPSTPLLVFRFRFPFLE